MAKPTTTTTLGTRLAFAHWSFLDLHHALYSTTATTALVTHARQAAYSTHKHRPASLKSTPSKGTAPSARAPHSTKQPSSRQGRNDPPRHKHRIHSPPIERVRRTGDLRTNAARPDFATGMRTQPAQHTSTRRNLVADQLSRGASRSKPLISETTTHPRIRTPHGKSESTPTSPPHFRRTQDHAPEERPYRPGYKNAEKHADRIHAAKLLSTSTTHQATPGNESTNASNNNNTSGKQESPRFDSKGAKNYVPFPTHFRIVPNTERIESADKEGVQQLFTRRIGARNLTNDAFSLKCARMTFYEPPVPNVPKFVKQAMEEYEEAMAKYRQNQQELASKQDTATPTSTDTIPATTTTTTTSLSMPKPSPFIRQYSLRNLRQYPATADSLHPPFRVVYVISKKTVSKLAVHRNLCRKKLSAAVEAVFREHARPGFEFMFFAKQKCVVTPQKELEELMIKALTDPGLYADTAISHRNKDRSAHAKLFEKASYSLLPSASPPSFPPLPDSEIAKDPAIKVRWKNNQPPLKWNWWRHALPHPLGRTRQPDEYLDMHCPKPSAEETLADVVKRDSIESAKLKK